MLCTKPVQLVLNEMLHIVKFFQKQTQAGRAITITLGSESVIIK